MSNAYPRPNASAEDKNPPAEPELSGGRIEFKRLETILEENIGDGIKIEMPGPASEGTQEGIHELLQEIVEDMLELLRRVQVLERSQAELAAQVVQIGTQVHRNGQAQAREISRLRSELLDDRRSLTAVSIFNGIVPVLDSLREMKEALKSDADSPVYNQVHALLQMLLMMLRGMGIFEFRVDEGESFDPRRMECAGYADGESGVVLELARPGYAIQDAVVRPAGVLIGKPAPSEPHSNPEETTYGR